VTVPANRNLEVVERGVMMLLLAERREWPLDELSKTINEERFEQALDNLEEVGLLIREGELVYASPAALRGDDLS
jgi:predicted transcriptional regulator